MKQDEYGTVQNDPKTYKGIVKLLKVYGSALIAWTDDEGTQFDILFTRFHAPFQLTGSIQGGLRWNDLFVSIMRIGAFGFEIQKDTDTHAGYYEEKFGREMGSTSSKLAELINGVRKELAV